MGIDKQTFRSGPYKNIFAQGTRVGNDLYLAGQVGVDASGQTGSGIVEQTRIAYQNVRDVLSEFGASMDNIVDETFFVTDVSDVMAQAEGVFAARAEAYGGIPEVCQTVVQIGALVMPDLEIEIKCIAKLES